jgi:ferredoxin-NADP reductase
MEHIVKIISIRNVTHNVKQIIIEKPKGFVFTPGQATDLTINEKEFKELKNPLPLLALTATHISNSP